MLLPQKLSSHLQAHATSESFIDGQKTSKADRCVTNHRDLVAALYDRYRMPVAEFPSDRVHDLAEELFMWYSARVVIIPHGAMHFLFPREPCRNSISFESSGSGNLGFR